MNITRNLMNYISENGWPQWPQYTKQTHDALNKVLESNRWAISGYWTGEECKEQTFAKAFASYNGVKYCVPTTNGSSALQVALEVLGVGVGDEVIMPALTWIATATAILKVNAKPILIDVREDNYCMDTSKIEAAISDKTKVIVVVHLMECMVNMDEVMGIARKHKLAVLEDCAQAHGMMWNNRRAGTIGDIGAFSFQQGKILTSGEGGAVITNNKKYFEKAEQLRSDSRKFIDNNCELKQGDMELENAGTMQGYNYCMSEFQAAILLQQMEEIEKFNEIKQENAKKLTEIINNIPGFSTIKIPKQINYQTFYGFMIKVDLSYFGGEKDCSDITSELRKELDIGSFFIHQIYKPVHKNEIFCPWTSNKYIKEIARDEQYWRSLKYPVAEKANSEIIVFHHSMLLAEEKKINEIGEALIRISRKN